MITWRIVRAKTKFSIGNSSASSFWANSTATTHTKSAYTSIANGKSISSFEDASWDNSGNSGSSSGSTFYSWGTSKSISATTRHFISWTTYGVYPNTSVDTWWTDTSAENSAGSTWFNGASTNTVGFVTTQRTTTVVGVSVTSVTSSTQLRYTKNTTNSAQLSAVVTSVSTTWMGVTTGTVNTTISVGTSASCAGEPEFGTVVSAEANDWLWRFNGMMNPVSDGLSAKLLSDVATAFEVATFWPTITDKTITYAATKLGASRVTITMSSANPVFYDRGFSTSSRATTVMWNGFQLPMGGAPTYSTAVLVGTSLSTASRTLGYRSQTAVGYSFESYKRLADCITTTNTTVLVYNTTVALATTVDSSMVVDWRTSLAAYNYSSTSSFNGSSGTTLSTREDVATYCVNVHQGYVDGYGAIHAIIPAAPYQGIKVPASMAQSCPFVTNIGFPSTIYYPFWSYLQSNQPWVYVPVVYSSTSAVGVSLGTTATWHYRWPNVSSLEWTKQTETTSVSDGRTVTVVGTTSGGGTLVPQGVNSAPSWKSSYGLVGGFGGMRDLTATAILQRGGAAVTTYDTQGNSNESIEIRGADGGWLTTQEQHATVRNEAVVVAVATFGELADSANLPVFNNSNRNYSNNGFIGNSSIDA